MGRGPSLAAPHASNANHIAAVVGLRGGRGGDARPLARRAIRVAIVAGRVADDRSSVARLRYGRARRPLGRRSNTPPRRRRFAGRDRAAPRRRIGAAFAGGPSITLVGPAELQIHSASAATLRSGKLVFRNDRPESTFDLRTPYSELVDLGTSYDVTLGTGFEEVRVFDGEVWRTPNDDTEAAMLIDAGKARRFGRLLPPFGEEIAASDPRPAPTREPLQQTRLRVSDAFAYADGTYSPGTLPLGGEGWSSPWRWQARNRVGETVDDAQLKIAGGEAIAAGIFFLNRRLSQPIRLADDGVAWFHVRFRWDGTPEPQDTLFVTLRTSEEFEASESAERFVALLRGARREMLVRFGGCHRTSAGCARRRSALSTRRSDRFASRSTRPDRADVAPRRHSAPYIAAGLVVDHVVSRRKQGCARLAGVPCSIDDADPPRPRPNRKRLAALVAPIAAKP